MSEVEGEDVDVAGAWSVEGTEREYSVESTRVVRTEWQETVPGSQPE